MGGRRPRAERRRCRASQEAKASDRGTEHDEASDDRLHFFTADGP
jgi:hypothetical protein